MTAAERGRGWGAVAALALATAFLSAVQPALLMFVPLALLFIALPPRRPLLLALGAFICWLAFTGEPAANALWYFERGWSLLLGAWFVVFVALMPRWTFLPRALSALGAAALSAAVVLLVNRGGFAILEAAVAARLRSTASQVLTIWEGMEAGRTLAPDMSASLFELADLQGRLFPSLLALASLAGLGVAWWAFGRVGQGIAQPLSRWREFRFRDELVWLLIAGIALLVLPLDQLATRAGENLLLFMAVLYALRGAAVLLVIGGVSGPLAFGIGVLLVVLKLTPFAMATTVIVGLSDTWLDMRARRQASSTPGS